MRPIRVLIVDDAVVIRRMLTDVLAGDPQIAVVGTAANGRIGLSKIPQVNPDLVTLDIEMPEMDGLQALAEIRKQYPKLPVIMFSTLTERGAAKTLEALALGASDYITKPANIGSVSLALDRIRTELLPRIKAFCAKAAGLDLHAAIPPAAFSERPAKGAGSTPGAPNAGSILPAPLTGLGGSVITRAPQKFPQRIDLVAIGVSTGGPNALAEVFPLFPRNLPVPIVITQHMPPVFTKILAERLTDCSELTVREGAPGEILKPGQAWIAPGGFHMTVERTATGLVLRTNSEPPENSCRPAVDVMFRSVAKVVGGHTLGVILTGMGQDGLRGCEDLCGQGAQVIVQDEQSSVVWGMPGFVARAGLAEKVLPLNEIGLEITRRVMAGRAGAAITFPKVEEGINAQYIA
jgi:two-component system chemotaxis response regulator CheB